MIGRNDDDEENKEQDTTQDSMHTLEETGFSEVTGNGTRKRKKTSQGRIDFGEGDGETGYFSRLDGYAMGGKTLLWVRMGMDRYE